MSYYLADKVQLLKRGGAEFLLSFHPLFMLRLNHSLAELLRNLDKPRSSSFSPSETAILEQLVNKGCLRKTVQQSDFISLLPTVSIVIPVKDRGDELRRSLLSISSLNYPKELLEVIVVDDGSSDHSAEVATELGAKVVSSGGAGMGPAAARNAGARVAGGEILAFIDSDCTATEGWLNELIPLFQNHSVAAVGGFVDGLCRQSMVDRYEASMSSLSLGNRERSGGVGDDTFYLPSCNLLVRRSAFKKAAGFREEMHVGEDVDLTWRLRDNGWTICYTPKGRVYHEHRSSIRSFMSRRFDYGTSEGILQRLHPGRHKKMLTPPALALLLAVIFSTPFSGWFSLPLFMLGIVADSLLIHRKLCKNAISIGYGVIVAGRLRALGSLLYYLSFHIVRYYSLPLLAVSLFVPLLLPLYFFLLLVSSGVDYFLKKPVLSYPAFVIIYILEHLSYGTGVFWGCFKKGTFASYRVIFTQRVESAA